MKNEQYNGLYTDLTDQEMVALNGGGNVIELVAKGLGFIIGSIARIQVYSGDNGQWMA